MISMRSYPFFLFIFLLILSENSWAQHQTYDYVQLKEELGLAQDFVYSISEDRKGFIWMCTGKGLSRYDGRSLDSFTKEHNLSDNFVTASVLLSSGEMLFGHSTGKITAHNGVFFESITMDTLKSEIISITEDLRKNIWCVSKSGGILLLNPDMTIKSLSFPGELQGKIVNDIVLQTGQLIVATNEGLYTFQISGTELFFVDSPDGLRTKELTSLESVHNDSSAYWIGSAEGEIFRAKSGVSTKIVASIVIPGLESAIQAIVESFDNSIWIGTLQHGIYQVRLNKYFDIIESVVLNEENGYPIREVKSIFIDSQKHIWIGTLGNGVIDIYPKYIQYVSLKELNVEKVNDIEEGAHHYYIATNIGMFRWANDSTGRNGWSKFNQLPADPVISLFRGVDDLLWIGTENSGIYKFSETTNHLTKVILDMPDGRPARARFFTQDATGNMWISTIGQGVFKLNRNDKLLSHLSTEVGFIHNDIFAIHPDKKGRVWFGSQGAGLARLDPDSSMHLLSQEGVFPSHDVNDITEDGDGNVWIATDGQGYFKFNETGFEKASESKDGLTAFVAGIAYNKHNRIWLTYRKGISYLDLRTGKHRDFTTKDGLQNNQSYGSKIMVDSKDNVLICHESGITILNALKANSELILRTYLTGVRISFEESVEVAPSKEQILASVFPSIALPHNQNHLTFDFTATAINYSGPIYYRYFIKEFEQTWSPPITTHSATYSSLNPGSYTLFVQATNNLETWADPILEYHFTIQKPYWQKWWFYLLQITGICALFGSTYLLSRNEKTKTSILRVMVFTCLFIVFEFIQNWVEPIASNHIGQAPIFKTLINLSLAILLLPMERTFRGFFAKHAPSKDLE